MAQHKSSSYAGVGTASLTSELDNSDDDPYVIHGVAIGVDDVTVGQSGTKKYWPAETLEQAAETLEDQPLVRDHINSTKGRIGTVTEAMYMPGKGVLYEAEIKSHYEDLARDVASGMMDVSPRIKHLPEAELSTRDGDDALVVEPPAVFDNLSVVNEGASPSNTAVFGDSPHMPDSEPATMATGEDGALATATLSQGTRRAGDVDEQFQVVASLEGESLDDVYDEWEAHVNMTATDLKQWAMNPCAKQASVDPKAVISRNLHLLETPRGEWGDSEIEDAKRTISFISRMSDEANEPDAPRDGPHGCPSKWAISLLNWAFNPFDSLPDQPEEGTLADEDGYSETELSVSYGETPDGQTDTATQMPEHGDELYDTREEAKDRADEIGCGGCHSHEVDGETKYMPCDSMQSLRQSLEDNDELNTNMNPVEVGAVFTSRLNDGAFVVQDIAGDRVRISHGEGDGWWERMGDIHDKINDGVWTRVDETEEMSDPAYSEGDWVRWNTRNSTEIGTVENVYHKGDDLPNFRGDRNYDVEEGEHLYGLRIYKRVDGTYHPATGGMIGHYEDSLESAAEPESVSDEAMDLEEMGASQQAVLGESNVDNMVVGENDWVQWYPDTGPEESHGKVERIDEKEDQDAETDAIVRKYQQDDDGVWHPTDHTVKLGMSEVEGWGNYPTEDAISDSRLARNPTEGALDEYDIASMPSQSRKTEGDGGEEDDGKEMSEQTKTALKNKKEEHNEEHGDEDGKKVTLTMLKKVYNKGLAAYGDSHRQGMTANQWAMARVNAFLYLVRNGNPENDNYTQDNEILPEDHPKHESSSSENADGSGPDGVAELADYEMHVPTYDGTHTDSWSRPDLEDFVAEMDVEATQLDDLTDEQQSQVAEHFIISEDGFPPETYGDLKLPVVEPDGRLSESALETVKGGRGVSAVDGLNAEVEDDILSMVDDLLESEFDHSEADEMGARLTVARSGVDAVAMSTEELAYDSEEDESSSMSGDVSEGDMVSFTVDGESMMGEVTDVNEGIATIALVEEGDDGMEKTGDEETMPTGALEMADAEMATSSQLAGVAVAAIQTDSEATASLTTTQSETMDVNYTYTDTEDVDVDEFEDPVIIERDEVESLEAEAAQADELEGSLEELSATVESLSEADELVAELSEGDEELLASDTETTVVEAELADMVEEVQTLYAEELAEYSPFTGEELSERFDPLELREKVSEHDEAALSAEITETEQDPDGGHGDGDEELAELEEGEPSEEQKVEAVAEELSSMGWTEQAEKVRDGEIPVDEFDISA